MRSLRHTSSGKRNWGRSGCALFLLCAAAAIASQAQTLTTLHSFDGADGALPFSELVQATNGNLYGTTVYGGPDNDGTVFEITPGGTLTTLYSFTRKSANPYAGLIQTPDGDLYGTTYLGDLNSDGTVFKITPSGILTTLHSFSGANGANPFAGLIEATDGSLYGTTYDGGADNVGTVFRITGGALTTLLSFDSTDGAYPVAGLVQATNGNFYGVTNENENDGYGTVFAITPSGALLTLHTFDGTDGIGPNAGLIQASDGNLYGTTYEGGANSVGTVFKIAPSGAFTTLHNFDSTDGAFPYAPLVQATDGNLYGTTGSGEGNTDYGTIFRITPDGTLTTIHSFNNTDGNSPYAALVQDTDGDFYGTTVLGGINNDGTVFRLSVALGPFVVSRPASGAPGAPVHILGTDLTGTTAVSFNGAAAAFTVISRSFITTSVPPGATTGFVTVVTPSGTLKSNQQFLVTP